jgi:hypothetical protein
MEFRISLIPFLLGLAILAGGSGCGFFKSETSTCAECHRALEEVSPAHGECVTCHGGNPEAREKEASHRGMYGPRNPSDPRVWEHTCGKCHPYQLQRLRSSLMYTNTGMIHNIQLTWEGEDGRLYASGRDENLFDADGEPLSLPGVTELNNLAGELYRKFCSLCHVRIESTQAWTASHGSGCSACHFPYNDNATYQGSDETMKGRWPHSATHEMAALPDNDVCFRCHNRSGRIALSYTGLNDGNNSLVPTRDGFLGPRIISGVRNATAIRPDIHFEKGMDCIDCHTSRDLMGDGYAYRNMYEQVEIRCEDCHGSATERPRSLAVTRENDEAVRESRSYQRQVRMGDELVLTYKGRKYSNVFVEDDKIWVIGKRSGKRHESKIITGTPEHTIVGHERMECYSCHSHTVVQCYGCHTEYDLSEKGRDFVKGIDTPGTFSETEDYRMLYPFPLALNQRGMISPVTPGCQTFITVSDPEGRTQMDGYVARYKDQNQLRFAPFYSHNTGKKAVGCRDCHSNPAFLGFGQHVVASGDIEPSMLCQNSKKRPLDGFLILQEGEVRAFSAITREESRPLNEAEVRRTWAVNLCLICHEDPKDPIYQEKLDYDLLDSCLARPVSDLP